MPHPQINDGEFGGAGSAPPIFGFWGKLPSRGDFLGTGLPKAVVETWDSWISASLAASQAAMGEDWQPAWMEAPVWCFFASAGCFGSDSVSGVWMPSVDTGTLWWTEGGPRVAACRRTFAGLPPPENFMSMLKDL
jgi:hypothetical protein